MLFKGQKCSFPVSMYKVQGSVSDYYSIPIPVVLFVDIVTIFSTNVVSFVFVQPCCSGTFQSGYFEVKEVNTILSFH